MQPRSYCHFSIRSAKQQVHRFPARPVLLLNDPVWQQEVLPEANLHCFVPGDVPRTVPLLWHWRKQPYAKQDARSPYFAGDDILVVAGLQNPEELDLKTVLRSLNVDNLDELISARVSVTGFFGARFRECAGRALLLPRAGFNKRTPLWLTRLRAKKLLATVRELPDFPIVLEAWRECLHDAFDMEGLRTHLTDIETGSIQIS